MTMDLVLHLECCYNTFFFALSSTTVFNKWTGNYLHCSHRDMHYSISCNMLTRTLVVSLLTNDERVRRACKAVLSSKTAPSECACYYYYRIWTMDLLQQLIDPERPQGYYSTSSIDIISFWQIKARMQPLILFPRHTERIMHEWAAVASWNRLNQLVTAALHSNLRGLRVRNAS